MEFLIAPNPGVPAGPLREIASGGELSRVMLALMSVAADGRAGRRWSSTRSTPASAARPRARSASSCAALAAGRQIVCITHLPQIASLADRHFTIVKDTSAETARTTVDAARRAATSSARSCGCSAPTARTARPARHAQELLRAA